MAKHIVTKSFSVFGTVMDFNEEPIPHGGIMIDYLPGSVRFLVPLWLASDRRHIDR